MPIVDQTYQRWGGTRHRVSPAWILARTQIRLLLRRWSVRILLLAPLVFLLVWGALIYVESQTVRSGPLAELGRAVRVDAASFRRFFVYQRLVHLLLCLAGADLIAMDRRARALSIYLARPLRARDYVLAKGLALALLLSLASWLPGLVLVLFKTALQADLGWLAAEWWLPGSILAYSGLLIFTLVLVTLALSSLSQSPRHASALVFAFVALTWAAGEVLTGLTRSDAWRLLSLPADFDQVAGLLFGTALPHDIPVATAVAALGGFMLVAVWVLYRRIRPFEVVGSG